MTIDERLDRLTERHEALAESLELLKGRTDDLTRAIEGLQKIVTAHDGYLHTIMTGVAQLLEVAANHERRLQKLEGV